MRPAWARADSLSRNLENDGMDCRQRTRLIRVRGWLRWEVQR